MNIWRIVIREPRSSRVEIRFKIDSILKREVKHEPGDLLQAMIEELAPLSCLTFHMRISEEELTLLSLSFNIVKKDLINE
jgi:hypothetical protein